MSGILVVESPVEKSSKKIYGKKISDTKNRGYKNHTNIPIYFDKNLMILAFIVVAEIIDGFHPSFGVRDLYSACPDPWFCGHDSGSLGRDLSTSFCDAYSSRKLW
jgi:hypothetical protein